MIPAQIYPVLLVYISNGHASLFHLYQSSKALQILLGTWQPFLLANESCLRINRKHTFGSTVIYATMCLAFCIDRCYKAVVTQIDLRVFRNIFVYCISFPKDLYDRTTLLYNIFVHFLAGGSTRGVGAMKGLT